MTPAIGRFFLEPSTYSEGTAVLKPSAESTRYSHPTKDYVRPGSKGG